MAAWKAVVALVCALACADAFHVPVMRPTPVLRASLSTSPMQTAQRSAEAAMLLPAPRAAALALVVTRTRGLIGAAVVITITAALTLAKKSSTKSAPPPPPAAPPSPPKAPPAAPAPAAWTKQAVEKIQKPKSISNEERAAFAESQVAAAIAFMDLGAALQYLKGPQPSRAGVSKAVLADAIAILEAQYAKTPEGIQLTKQKTPEMAEAAVAAELYSLSAEDALTFLSGPMPKKAGVSDEVIAEAIAILTAGPAEEATDDASAEAPAPPSAPPAQTNWRRSFDGK